MQCPVVQERDGNRGNVKMKTINSVKNPYRQESNLDNIVDQLCTRLQDIKDQEGASLGGMPTRSLEQTEAVRRYYAAFPALKKGEESPLQYYLPPPAWCRKATPQAKVKMQNELLISKDWNSKNKKYSFGKERRGSSHGQKKNNRRRFSGYGRCCESKENLPEWVTNEEVWDMETQDPVGEFIRAIALDEGYGTCENAMPDELGHVAAAKLALDETAVPDWDDGLDLGADWLDADDLDPRPRSPVEDELYAKFEAKFDRSIEALWGKERDSPDDYRDLPIDFRDLLASPSDRLFADPSAEKCSLISLTESIWSIAETAGAERVDSPAGIAERLRPLTIEDAAPRARDDDAFAPYEGDELDGAAAAISQSLRSFTAINHSRDRSGFVEVPPRRRAAPAPPVAPRPPPPPPRDDALTSARTHFRPIRREPDAEPARYADGDTFDIRGDLDPVEFRRSDSGGVYLAGTRDRYLEYRAARGVDYGRLNLTAAQRCPDLEDPAFRLRFPVRQRDAAAQTERCDAAWRCDECGGCAKKMRPSAVRSIWSELACGCAAAAAAGAGAGAGAGGEAPRAHAPPPDELSREWEELLRDISAAHRQYAGEADEAEEAPAADRKRRHSAALRCRAPAPCSHPHARFLHCCAAALDRPLTR